MSPVLHILTPSADELAAKVIAAQRDATGRDADVVDLRVESPNYEALLERIFAAEKACVW